MNDEKLHHGLMFLPFSCRNLCTHKYRKHPLGFSTYHQKMNNFYNLMHSGLIIQFHTDTPYRQDPNLGKDKGGLLGPKKDKYKVCSFLAKAHKIFWVLSWLDSQFFQALTYQNRSRALYYIDTMTNTGENYCNIARGNQGQP